MPMPLTAIMPVLLTTFQVATMAPENDPPSNAAPPSAVAVRASSSPVIDGISDDAVWGSARRITEFREFQPREDGDPRFATEAMVAYDARNLCVFVRMFDPRPDSILPLMARRDVRTPHFRAPRSTHGVIGSSWGLCVHA